MARVKESAADIMRAKQAAGMYPALDAFMSKTVVCC